MAVFTPSYPLTFPTVSGITTQRFALTRTVAVSASPFTGQEQVFQHEGEILVYTNFFSTYVKR